MWNFKKIKTPFPLSTLNRKRSYSVCCKAKGFDFIIILFTVFVYEAAAPLPLSCREAFASFSQTAALSKSVGPQKIKEALDRGFPLNLLEDIQHDLVSKGWVFPPPLDPNNPKALHSALNRGAVTVALESSLTPEIGYKVGDAILANYVTKFVNRFSSNADFGHDRWPYAKRAFIKTGKISQEEIDQFEQELYQVGQELKSVISAADGRNIVLSDFTAVETENHFPTFPSGHRHKDGSDGAWITAVYTVYGPAGTLFETEDGRPSAVFPEQALLLPEKERNRTIFREDRKLPRHATPRHLGRRLMIIFVFRNKSYK